LKNALINSGLNGIMSFWILLTIPKFNKNGFI